MLFRIGQGYLLNICLVSSLVCVFAIVVFDEIRARGVVTMVGISYVSLAEMFYHHSPQRRST